MRTLCEPYTLPCGVTLSIRQTEEGTIIIHVNPASGSMAIFPSGDGNIAIRSDVLPEILKIVRTIFPEKNPRPTFFGKLKEAIDILQT